jgi:hypothetical protein
MLSRALSLAGFPVELLSDFDGFGIFEICAEGAANGLSVTGGQNAINNMQVVDYKCLACRYSRSGQSKLASLPRPLIVL